MTKKEKLVEEANLLEIDTEGLTVEQLEEAIAAVSGSSDSDEDAKDSKLADSLIQGIKNLRTFIADNKGELVEQLDNAKVSRMAAHLGMVEQVFNGDR